MIQMYQISIYCKINHYFIHSFIKSANIYYHRLGTQGADAEDTDTDAEDSSRLQETDHLVEETRNKHLLTTVITLAGGIHRALKRN